jgi:membrane dipeptidase
MIYKFRAVTAILLLTGAASSAADNYQCDAGDPWCRSDATDSRGYVLIDTHIDVPYRMKKAWVDVTTATEDGDFDYDRAITGGLDIPFMSIYTPPKAEEDGSAWQIANQLIDGVEAITARAPDRFVMVHSVADAKKAHVDGNRIGLALGMENGAPIAGKLENLQHFYNRGIRYITLAHSKSNHISDSSYDENRQWDGLSEFGQEVVAEMNRLGIMIDVSHVSDAAFEQVMELSKAPVIASHSSARHFTPDWERNMSDDMIRQLAANGGVIQINFGSDFISQETREWSNTYKAIREPFLKANNFDDDSDAAEAFKLDYREKNPYAFTTLASVVDHYDHVIKLVGVDHVGIGSDYDGVGDSLPEGLKDVSAYPALIAEFERRGYSNSDIRKILGLNLLRVWQAVEDYASQAGSDQ